MTRLPRIARAAALLTALALSAGACEFNGAYDLPLPGSPVDEDHSFEVSAEFQDILNEPESAGRKLEFLTQEMFRETNTIGSKAGDVEISRHVVEIKGTLEKIRELVQNVE